VTAETLPTAFEMTSSLLEMSSPCAPESLTAAEYTVSLPHVSTVWLFPLSVTLAAVEESIVLPPTATTTCAVAATCIEEIEEIFIWEADDSDEWLAASRLSPSIVRMVAVPSVVTVARTALERLTEPVAAEIFDESCATTVVVAAFDETAIAVKADTLTSPLLWSSQ
jgi:hypothetical protein